MVKSKIINLLLLVMLGYNNLVCGTTTNSAIESTQLSSEYDAASLATIFSLNKMPLSTISSESTYQSSSSHRPADSTQPSESENMSTHRKPMSTFSTKSMDDITISSQKESSSITSSENSYFVSRESVKNSFSLTSNLYHHLSLSIQSSKTVSMLNSSTKSIQNQYIDSSVAKSGSISTSSSFTLDSSVLKIQPSHSTSNFYHHQSSSAQSSENIQELSTSKRKEQSTLVYNTTNNISLMKHMEKSPLSHSVNKTSSKFYNVSPSTSLHQTSVAHSNDLRAGNTSSFRLHPSSINIQSSHSIQKFSKQNTIQYSQSHNSMLFTSKHKERPTLIHRTSSGVSITSHMGNSIVHLSPSKISSMFYDVSASTSLNQTLLTHINTLTGNYKFSASLTSPCCMVRSSHPQSTQIKVKSHLLSYSTVIATVGTMESMTKVFQSASPYLKQDSNHVNSKHTQLLEHTFMHMHINSTRQMKTPIVMMTSEKYSSISQPISKAIIYSSNQYLMTSSVKPIINTTASTAFCIMECVIAVEKERDQNFTDKEIENMLNKEFQSFDIKTYSNIAFFGKENEYENGFEYAFNLTFNEALCAGSLRNTVYNKAKIFYDGKKFNGIFLVDSFRIKPYDPDPLNLQTFKVSIKLTSIEFNVELKDKSSKLFKELEKEMIDILTKLYQRLKGFVKVLIKNFEKGSVVTNYEVEMDKNKTSKSAKNDIENITQIELEDGQVGKYNASKEYSVSEKDEKKDDDNEGEDNDDDDDGGNETLKILLLVLIIAVVLLMIAVIIVIFQKRKLALYRDVFYHGNYQMGNGEDGSETDSNKEPPEKYNAKKSVSEYPNPSYTEPNGLKQ